MDDVKDNVIPNKTQKPEQHYRQKDNMQKPFSDLRELLNHKRQANESKLKVPPEEPKYNPLRDPLRGDNDRTEPVQNSTRSFPSSSYEYRGRGRGRGRGRSRGRRGYFHSQTDETRNENFTPAGQEQKPEHFNSQSRPVSRSYHKRNYYNSNRFNSIPQNDKFEENNQQQEETRLRNNRQESNTSSRTSIKYPSPGRYNNPHKRNPKPVNITVEYFVNSGTRKCTLEKSDKLEIDKNLSVLPKCAEVSCEENWDENVLCDDNVSHNEDEVDAVEEDVKNENLEQPPGEDLKSNKDNAKKLENEEVK